MTLDKTPACDPLKLMTWDHNYNHYCVEVDRSVKLDDITSPGFWRHIKTLHVNDLVEVISPSLDVLLRVTVAGNGLVATRTLRVWEDKPAEAKAEAGGVRFIPGKKRWTAYGPDGGEVSSGHASRLEAEQALAERAAA